MTEKDHHPQIIDTGQIALLERLCNAAGVSGYEYDVRRIVLEQVQRLAAEVRVDALGNVLAYHPGWTEPESGRRLRVMVAAHMDEVGLMLVEDEGEGVFRFEIMGGINPIQLAGKAMWVGREKIPGVIGTPPAHFFRDKEFGELTVDMLRIDIGPTNAGRVKPGECAVFATPFQQIGPALRAKALDDRIGVTTLIELLRDPPPNIDLLAAFTVQEETSLRGAAVAAYQLDPDLVLVLDCTPANDLPPLPAGDLPPAENERYNTRMGCGPAVYAADRHTIGDPRLVKHLIATAGTLGIPYQVRQPGGGGTDAGAIHKARRGIPSVSLSVPGRYLHTAAGIVRLEDWQNTLALARAALERLPGNLLTAER